jgi:hypothetical protein
MKIMGYWRDCMNEENTGDLLAKIVQATFIVALSESAKQEIWNEAKKVNSDYPTGVYFEKIIPNLAYLPVAVPAYKPQPKKSLL